MRRGGSVLLSGVVTPASYLPRPVSVYVRAPRRTMWTLAAYAPTYLRLGQAVWTYAHGFALRAPTGNYAFRAAVPAGDGFAGSTSATLAWVRVY